jgi:FtsZ family, C-terminal domain
LLSQAATSAPLIERSIERATGIVYNITGGQDLTLQEVNRWGRLGATVCSLSLEQDIFKFYHRVSSGGAFVFFLGVFGVFWCFFPKKQ